MKTKLKSNMIYLNKTRKFHLTIDDELASILTSIKLQES